MSAQYDVIVIGAGAAGLMCAMTAAQKDRRVLVLERSNKPGKKILMSGGGRCNFTNLHIHPDRFLSQNPHFCKSALSRYTQWHFIELVEQAGIAYHEKTQGQLFCDHSSKDILNLLLHHCRQSGVELLTHYEIETVDSDGGYRLLTSLGEFSCDALVVASGGLSIPKMGGSGFGYDLARQFDLSLFPTRAGLVPFTLTDQSKGLCERLSGVSAKAQVSVPGMSFEDDVLFTHRGLSGPAILQLSSYWQEGDSIRVNLLPEGDLLESLKSLKHQQPKALLRTVLSERLPRKLVLELEPLFWPEQQETVLAEWSDKALALIVEQLTNWQLKPAGTEGYRTAEVTLGGVDTRSLSSKTMESSQHSGLFFIGEVVDVTGHLGGFNFQWAWSSGHACGEAL